jgi:hypothetical protein
VTSLNNGEEAMSMKTDTASNDPRDYDDLDWINILLKELQADGLVCDTGERRDGQICWKITPAGRKVLREQAKE